MVFSCCCQSRRSFLLGFSSFSLMTKHAFAQQPWEGGIEGSCSFYPDDHVDTSLFTFGSSQEAVDVVTRITNAVGLAPNFEVQQANVPNAAAVIKNGQRYILYSQVFIEQIIASTSTEWASWTVIAHEVGHHLNGHTLLQGGSRPPIELQADRFAGHVVKRLGGSLDDALACFRQMNASGSTTHPPRSARLEAVTKGWKEALAPALPRIPRSEPAPEPPAPEQPRSRPSEGPTKRVKHSVSLGYLNMRSGPGTNYSVVVRVPAGSTGVRITGSCVRAQDGSSKYPFCKVEWKGHRGWLSSNGLE